MIAWFDLSRKYMSVRKRFCLCTSVCVIHASWSNCWSRCSHNWVCTLATFLSHREQLMNQFINFISFVSTLRFIVKEEDNLAGHYADQIGTHDFRSKCVKWPWGRTLCFTSCNRLRLMFTVVLEVTILATRARCAHPQKASVGATRLWLGRMEVTDLLLRAWNLLFDRSLKN